MPGTSTPEREGAAPGRDGVDDLAVHDALARGALHVDGRCFAGHGDRFLEGADAHLGVDRGDERAGQLDPFAPDDGEARQREGDAVDARPEIDDPILAGPVGHDGADLLDQRGAGGFDGHAGQHGTRGIAHDTRDRRLAVHDGGNEHHA